MGFFSTLEKSFYKVEDIMIAVGDQYAKRIDRLADEEIEKRYSRSVDEVRMSADMIQMQSEMLKMKKEEHKMQSEIMRMQQEQYECADDFGK